MTKSEMIKNAKNCKLPNVSKKEVIDEKKEAKDGKQCNVCLPCDNSPPLDKVNQKFTVDKDYIFKVPCYNPPPTDYLRVLTYNDQSNTFIIKVKPIY